MAANIAKNQEEQEKALKELGEKEGEKMKVSKAD